MQKETEAALTDFRFSVLIFGEQIKDPWSHYKEIKDLSLRSPFCECKDTNKRVKIQILEQRMQRNASFFLLSRDKIRPKVKFYLSFKTKNTRLAGGTGSWVIAAVIPKYLSQRLFLLTLERRKSVIQEVMRSLDVRPRQLSRVTGMNYETIRSIAKKWGSASIWVVTNYYKV